MLVPASLLGDSKSLRRLDVAQTIGYSSLWQPELLLELDQPPWLRDVADVPSDAVALAISEATRQTASATVRTDLLAQERCLVVAQPGDDPAMLLPTAHARSNELPETDALELRRDFCALGFAYLGLKVVYAQMDREDPLDVVAFMEGVQHAAVAFVDGEREALESALTACFDALHNARMTVYPATIELLDLVLLAPATTAEDVRRRVRMSQPFNLIATGAELDELHRRNPDALVDLAEGVRDNYIELLGSGYDDRPPGVLPAGSIIWQFVEAAKSAERLLQRAPETFGSRVGRLDPDLPRLLAKMGFRYGVHAAFDGCKMPQFRESKIKWNAADVTPLECLCRVARNGADESEPLGFFTDLASTILADRAATVVVARWLNCTSFWMDAVFRIQRRAGVFGKFATLADFFISSSMPDGPTRTFADEYLSALAKQTTHEPWASPDRQVGHFERRGHLDCRFVQSALLSVACAPVECDVDAEEAALERNGALPAACASPAVFADTWTRGLLGLGSERGWLIVNPSSFPRRAAVELPTESTNDDVASTLPVRAAQRTNDKLLAVVDVPGWGFCWLPKCAPTPVLAPIPASRDVLRNLFRKPQAEVQVANGRRLSNDFVEAEIDRNSGGLRGIWSARSGYIRLGQQLASSTNGTMACASIDITANGKAMGEITSRGVLRMEADKLEIAFRQRFRLWAAKPILEIEIEFEHLLNSWFGGGKYLAVRWAWPDDKAKLSVADAFTLRRHRRGDFETAFGFELRERNLSTSVFCPGLPFHRRVGGRMADTLLAAVGSERRIFRFAVGLDLAQWWAGWADFAEPVVVIPTAESGTTSGKSGWLIKLAPANVRSFLLRPVTDDAATIRFGFVETEGKGVRATLSFCRNPKTARLVNGKGELQFELYVEGDTIHIDFSPFEMLFVEVEFE